MGEGDQKVKTSNYKTHKFWGYKVHSTVTIMIKTKLLFRRN